jgi:protein TilB
MYTKEGEIRQCNEGRFKFSLLEYDDPDYTFFSIEVPRHLETSELEVNINPKWVSVLIKKQLTQLRLTEEIIVHESKS